jgi:hypothetical protein
MSKTAMLDGEARTREFATNIDLPNTRSCEVASSSLAKMKLSAHRKNKRGKKANTKSR